MRTPTVVSTFAGCGGSSLGYKMAGFKCLLAVEWDKNAAATYQKNFPTTQLFVGDIAKLSNEEALRLAGVKQGELDVFDGSPPCQGFSTAGKRQLDDERNQLFREYVRLLRAFKPRAMVMENVVGMVAGKMRAIFKEICEELDDAGYKAQAKTLVASQHGAPQKRPRVVIIGVRKDFNVAPSHPPPRTMPISTEVACSGLSGNEEHESQRRWLLEECANRGAYKHFEQIPMGMSMARALATPNNGFSAQRLHSRRPAFTIMKNDGNIGLHGHMHWLEKRRCTVPELKRISGFPDDFVFVGEWKDGVQRIGNCVPPPLMRDVAQHIKDNILTRLVQKKEQEEKQVPEERGPEEENGVV